MEIRFSHNATYDFGIGVHHCYEQGHGPIQSFNVSCVRTSRDLQQQLGIDIDALYGCASFGAGVEARFNYMKERRYHSCA
ncbi:hypothetical protein P9597_29595 [Aneurinibacillus migulanus]|uniref:hypothetical protein n=1 Tax=Aneurinibacillus migulanus TaxID=47500 RepID=UPI002E235676|nr:hypothetical protein [Aneurinibacillus migulanus]